MTTKASLKLLAASLGFSAVVLTSVIGRTQIPTPTANWVNIKDPKFGAIGNGKHDDTAAIQAAIDYAFAHNLTGVYCPAGTYKTSSTIYLDPPGNLRLSLSSPTMSQFQMSFFGDPAAGGAGLQGCKIRPNFNNNIAFLVGTGQGMRVSDIAVIGPGGSYRGLQPSTGVGIGLAGGSGGSAGNLVENTYVANFYTLYQTNANGGCCLDDSNTFLKVAGDNGFYGIFFYGTQTYVDDVIDPRIGRTTISIDSEYSHQVNVLGGNLSATSALSNSFDISNISSFFQGTGCNDIHPGGWCFTTTIASPDQYVGTVYDSYMIVTAHFGVIPLQMVSWNASTNVATLGMWMPWLLANYGTNGQFVNSGIQEEIQASITLYAAERAEVARGMGITLEGVHIENPSACTALFVPSRVWSGQLSNEIRDPFFNYDPSGINTNFTTAEIYCQQSFPFIGGDREIDPALNLHGGNYSAAVNPLIIDAFPWAQISGSQLGASFNTRVFQGNGYAYGQLGSSGNNFATVARGIGRWDVDYFLPASTQFYPDFTELTTEYCGYEPCPGTTPNLSPTLYALVSGRLGALGTYPPIACRTIFKSVDWNSGTLSHPFHRSASCPGYSWGQDLTDATVGETVTWSYMAGSDVLYLDAKTLGWMFPGLGISLDSGSGAQPYIITGVYPYLGYITVIWAGSNSGASLQGTARTVYSCSSGCSILQAPFAWTSY